MTGLNIQSIINGPKLEHVGHKILCLKEADSTNEQAWREAVQGAPSGTVIFADAQTRGRGRHGRTWFSPPGTSLLFSILLRLDISLDRLPLVNAVSALAAAQGLEEISGCPVRIRFPNDLMSGDKKLGGILVESRLISNRLDFVIVGIGINVNVVPEDFPRDLRASATSLSAIAGKPFSRESVSRRIMSHLDRRLDLLLRQDLEEIRREWKSMSSVLGQRVRIEEGGKRFTGTVDDLDAVDGLILRMDNGLIRGFRSEHIQQLTMI